jgi:hypothetical protein
MLGIVAVLNLEATHEQSALSRYHARCLWHQPVATHRLVHRTQPRRVSAADEQKIRAALIQYRTPIPWLTGRVASPGMLLEKFPPMIGSAPPNRVGGTHGGNYQHGRAARGFISGAVAERYRSAGRVVKRPSIGTARTAFE